MPGSIRAGGLSGGSCARRPSSGWSRAGRPGRNSASTVGDGSGCSIRCLRSGMGRGPQRRTLLRGEGRKRKTRWNNGTNGWSKACSAGPIRRSAVLDEGDTDIYMTRCEHFPQPAAEQRRPRDVSHRVSTPSGAAVCSELPRIRLAEWGSTSCTSTTCGNGSMYWLQWQMEWDAWTGK